ncbi:Thioesterase-like superfamily protein [Brevibacterium siliguriense]|uniref:Thioesterase-like superfamily protein n=1 Tax=Brevibacterium siliguriense TaxID=1136497 RepID=A0A1H1WAY1_9MICO|nr:acyl-CoA thioesterase [Brevibacterium siliguriense]SDS93800.1 Thioesterase-like superfamily protein [Brevibacterium siliguriense]
MSDEIDIYTHVINGMYFTMMDLSRLDMMVRSGVWDALRARRRSGVVSEESIRFRKSLKLGQRYCIGAKISGVDERAVCFERRIVVDGEIYARASVATKIISEAGTIAKDEMIKVFGSPPSGLKLPT